VTDTGVGIAAEHLPHLGDWSPAHRTYLRERRDAEQQRVVGISGRVRRRRQFDGRGDPEGGRAVRTGHGRERFWIADQCGGRVCYSALEEALGSDWGVCTNAASPYDGRLLFEHDGCEQFRAAPPPDVMVDDAEFGRLRSEAMRVTTSRKPRTLDWEAYARELERRVQQALHLKRDGPSR